MDQYQAYLMLAELMTGGRKQQAGEMLQRTA